MHKDTLWASAFALALMLVGCGSDGGAKPGDGTGDGDRQSTGDGDGEQPGDGQDSGDGDGEQTGDGAPAGDGDGDGDARCSDAADVTATFRLIDPGLDELGTPDQNAEGGKALGFTGVAYGDGVWVAVARSQGEDVIRWARSEDGESWTAHSQPTGNGTTFTNSRVHFAQGKFLFFGEHSYNGGGVSFAYVSSDGMSWEANHMSDSRLVLDEFASSDDLTILAGHDMDMRRSSDLKTWTGTGIGAGYYSYNDVAYGNGVWLTSTNGEGKLWSSTDGMTWTAVPDVVKPGTGYWMEFGNGVWIVQGSGGPNYKISRDGLTFTDITATGPVAGARFTGGRFLGWNIGYTDQTFPDQIDVSSTQDGMNWHAMGSLKLALPEGAERMNAAMPDAVLAECKVVIATTLTIGGGGKSQLKPVFVVGDLAP